MSIENTSKIMREAAETLSAYAKRMEHYADELDRTGEYEICGEALNAVTNMVSNLRLDLFVTRPLRDMRLRVYELEQQLSKHS